ncbi:hypothetical protein FM102_03455 [Corynebacterium glutamicum]|nr:hypothetical protein FM102_03455 [Corynebacterium glutamicum]
MEIGCHHVSESGAMSIGQIFEVFFAVLRNNIRVIWKVGFH